MDLSKLADHESFRSMFLMIEYLFSRIEADNKILSIYLLNDQDEPTTNIMLKNEVKLLSDRLKLSESIYKVMQYRISNQLTNSQNEYLVVQGMLKRMAAFLNCAVNDVTDYVEENRDKEVINISFLVTVMNYMMSLLDLDSIDLTKAPLSIKESIKEKEESL